MDTFQKIQKQLETVCKTELRKKGEKINKEFFRCYIHRLKKDTYECLVDNGGLSYDSMEYFKIEKDKNDIFQVT
jgi:hypothetical protein